MSKENNLLPNQKFINPAKVPKPGNPLDQIARDIFAELFQAGKMYKKEFRLTVLSNLIRNLYDNRKSGFVYSRDKNHYPANSLPHYSYVSYTQTVDQLVKSGYVTVQRKGYWDGTKGEATLIIASERLAEMFNNVNVEPPVELLPGVKGTRENAVRIRPQSYLIITPEDHIIVRGTDDKKTIVPQKKIRHRTELPKLKSKLRRYNRFIAGVSVLIPENVSSSKEAAHTIGAGELVYDEIAVDLNEYLRWCMENPLAWIHISALPVDTEIPVTINTTLSNEITNLKSWAMPDSQLAIPVPQLAGYDKFNENQTTTELMKKGVTLTTIAREDSSTGDTDILPLLPPTPTLLRQFKRTSTAKPLIYKELHCKLHRVFNRSSLEFGGRYYGAEYQHINSRDRAKILIDGEEVVEYDYSGLHFSMLMHEEKHEIIGDAYDVFDGNPHLRKATKLYITIAINAPNIQSADSAFYEKINEEKLKTIKNEMSLMNIRAGDIRNRFIERYPMAEKFFGTDQGIRLMRIDSDMATDVLMHFTEKKIPCLCVHDSFIVQKRHGEELQIVMKRVYMERFGYDIGVK